MGTIVLLMAIVILAVVFLLATGLKNLRGSVGPWNGPRDLHLSPPHSDSHRFRERRHFDPNYPLQRRRSDHTGGEG